MYTFSPQIIHPYVLTSHLLTVAYKIYACCRAPNFHIQPMTSTFVSSLTGVYENKNPLSLSYLVFVRATITTRPATLGGSRSNVALNHSSNNHKVALPSPNSEIIYHRFVAVAVRVCVCVCVCASANSRLVESIMEPSCLWSRI